MGLNNIRKIKKIFSDSKIFYLFLFLYQNVYNLIIISKNKKDDTDETFSSFLIDSIHVGLAQTQGEVPAGGQDRVRRNQAKGWQV